MSSDKREKLERLARHFRHIPFVDFVLLSGSMALGEERDDSDFDLIVGARAGRIFTVRFCSYVWFKLIGARRGRGEKRAKDKLCFNHFVTSASYRLPEPHNPYWVALYQHLIPLYDKNGGGRGSDGNENPVKAFFIANADWAGKRENYGYPIPIKLSTARRIMEWALRGRIGDEGERFLKKLQLRRIEAHVAHDKGYNPQVRYDDEEVRFHIDTRRIDEWVQEWYTRDSK